MNVLLISCYDLGHQPFAVASASAHLLERGHHVECLDLAVQDFEEEKIIDILANNLMFLIKCN